MLKVGIEHLCFISTSRFTMNKGLFTTILLAILFVVVNRNQVLAQAQGKQINFIDTEVNLEHQAKDFIVRLGEFIDIDESQKTSLVYLRFKYLTSLKMLEDDPKLSMENKKKEAGMIQKEYDEQFSAIFTAEQKLALKKKSVIPK